MPHTDPGVDVMIVSAGQDGPRMLQSIQAWNANNHLAKANLRSINAYRDISQALQHLTEFNVGQAIVVALGYPANQILDASAAWRSAGLEIILQTSAGNGGANLDEINDLGTASLLDANAFTATTNALAVLRKSVLRRHCRKALTIHGIGSTDELSQYFRLRYKVWTAMEYLPDTWNDRDSEWEVHYSDRTGYPIGAFDRTGKLVGCARLVFPLGDEDEDRVEIVTELLRATGYPSLLRFFSLPSNAHHPFDLLDAFGGFKEYYRQLILRKIKHAEISRVIVSDEYRQYGLGEVMVDTLKSIAKSQFGVTTLLLACHHRLQTFYERCGFRVLPGLECTRFANVNAPAIAMECRPRTSTIH